MFFINDTHYENFNRCIEKFNCINREYSSACYIAAHPGIFKCFALGHQVDGPFDWYFDCLDNVPLQNHRSTGSTAPLTNQTTVLVNLALNLWNGKKIDLASGLSIWDSELYAVALQAINLRQQGRSIIYE